ncbi:FAD-dependent monooxygenase [Pinirhizobacter soli]|uniref:FAD-dependent monooxygenase n=1 Tax=Pinirhizobacter soli TaxID=2786953 RepID=UPI00202A1FA4|nr:FAD-dependent monooxygenase [Pinirhizobacter soli]
MTEHAVAIAGCGPTGMMLAAELALAGVDVVVIERRSNQDLDGSRAGGLHSRTVEVLDQRGVAERFISEGKIHLTFPHSLVCLDFSELPSRHNYVLGLWQRHIERIMSAWIEELGIRILRGCEVVGFAQDNTGVDVKLSNGNSLRAEYLVGCDGGRSVVRKAAGIDFTGLEPSTSWLIAEVEMDQEPEAGLRRDSHGTHGMGRTEEGGPIRVVLTERALQRAGDPGMDELREALVAVYGTDYGLRSASWISRFTDMTRQAVSYRKGRVLLAGDAAHIHPPQGGQGLNTGVQDAMNLGWKLAQVVKRTSPESLLDTYHAERYPVGARVLRNTVAQVVLSMPDDRHQALRATMIELLDTNEPRRRFAAMLSGLDIHYDLGDGHPLLGRRMPDLDLHTADGPMRVFTLLHQGRPVLIKFEERGNFDKSSWADRIQLVDASYDGKWELPVLGEIAAPSVVLIRPDGYVAWAGDHANAGLTEALTAWFGPAPHH